MQYAPRILVIEDEPGVGSLFERILAADGYSITAATSGRQALSILRSTAVDLVIVDMSLPDYDGPDIIREILHEFPFVKALAASGRMEAPMERLARRAGAVTTFRKPISPRELRRRVYSILDPSGAWRGPS